MKSMSLSESCEYSISKDTVRGMDIDMDIELSNIDGKPEETGMEDSVGEPAGSLVGGDGGIVCVFALSVGCSVDCTVGLVVGVCVCVCVGGSIGHRVDSSVSSPEGRDVGLKLGFCIAGSAGL